MYAVILISLKLQHYPVTTIKKTKYVVSNRKVSIRTADVAKIILRMTLRFFHSSLILFFVCFCSVILIKVNLFRMSTTAQRLKRLLCYRARTSKTKMLLTFRQEDEKDKWSESAVETLVKKLEGTPGAFEDLEQALSNPGAPSKCVSIPRTVDGRIQVMHRKGAAHVVYCRVWRFPDLQTQKELVSLDCCEHPYSPKGGGDHVCINPYHYRRIYLDNLLPAVLVPRKSEFPQGPSVSESNSSSDDEDVGTEPDLIQWSSSGSNTSEESYAYQRHQQKPESKPPANLKPGEVQVKYHHPPEAEDVWATIAYFESLHRVGDMFRCHSYSSTIDGFTNPGQNQLRFSLGALSNVNRDLVTGHILSCIGKGARLTYHRGDVFIQCLSNFPLFIECKCYSVARGYRIGTVYKIPPGISLKVFALQDFTDQLAQAVDRDFDAVYDLIKLCTLRMSFVKGWGVDYKRQDVTGTPCWIEIHLNGPLEWVDRVLAEMGSTERAVSSIS